MNKRKRMMALATAALLMMASAQAISYRSIVSVEGHKAGVNSASACVSIESPVGTVPRLPYLLWVEYSDGKGEWRQVKWANAPEASEQAEANPAVNAVGTTLHS